MCLLYTILGMRFVTADCVNIPHYSLVITGVRGGLAAYKSYSHSVCFWMHGSRILGARTARQHARVRHTGAHQQPLQSLFVLSLLNKAR